MHFCSKASKPKTTAAAMPIFVQSITSAWRRSSAESPEALARSERMSRILCIVCSKRMLNVGFCDTGGGTFKNSSSVAVSRFSNRAEFLSTSDQVAMKCYRFASSHGSLNVNLYGRRSCFEMKPVACLGLSKVILYVFPEPSRFRRVKNACRDPVTRHS